MLPRIDPNASELLFEYCACRVKEKINKNMIMPVVLMFSKKVTKLVQLMIDKNN